jgi:hypothetical protein
VCAVNEGVPKAMSVVEVWREPSQFWRWRYIEPSGDGTPAMELPSNEVYEQREAAVEAAMTAYPGVPVRERGTPPGAVAEERPPRGGMRSRSRLLTMLAVAAVLLAWRWRRRDSHRARSGRATPKRAHGGRAQR